MFRNAGKTDERGTMAECVGDQSNYQRWVTTVAVETDVIVSAGDIALNLRAYHVLRFRDQ